MHFQKLLKLPVSFLAGSALSNFPITLESSAKFTYVHTVRHKIRFGKIQTHSTETRSKMIAYILRTVHLIRKFLEEPLFLYAKKNVLNAKISFFLEQTFVWKIK